MTDAPAPQHDGHLIVIASGRQPDGDRVGWRVCVDCSVIVATVAFCRAPTKRGRPCQIAIRPDLGYARCPAHRKAS